MPTFRQALKEGQKILQEANCGDQAAQLFLVELANLRAHDLYLEMDQPMESALYEQYQEGIERMKQGEPLGHVLGYEWFYGYRFQVNGDVLIPRPETEELVANVLAEYDTYFAAQEDVVAADIGTGSGAIAVALKKEAPALNMIASDISTQALSVARQNAADNEAKIAFLAGDMLEPLVERELKFDILISNPPYIPNQETMEHSVVDYEPHVALFGGEDGLTYYRRIFENCRKVLKPKALLAFEMGWNQSEAMKELMHVYFPQDRYEIIKDMSGKDRMLFIYINL